MKRTLLIMLCLGLLAGRPCQAKDDAVSGPVLVSWENGRSSSGKESRAGALISWEPGSGPRAAVAPAVQTPPPVAGLRPLGARQFDIEEAPLAPTLGVMPPTKIVPVTTAFSPYYPETGNEPKSS